MSNVSNPDLASRGAEPAEPVVDAVPRSRQIAVTGLRVTAVVQVVGILLQAILAGFILTDRPGTLDMHFLGGMIVLVSGLVQLVFAVIYWRPGRGTARLIIVTAVIFLAEFAQFGLGADGGLLVHIPLGVALFGGSVRFVAMAWTVR